MKHIFKIMALLVAISALWIGLLQTSMVPQSYALLLPIYSVVSLGCYGLLMVGVGLMQFPTCPQEAVLLQQDPNFKPSTGVKIGLWKMVEMMFPTNKKALKLDAQMRKFHEVEVMYDDIVEAKEFLKRKGVDVGSN